MLLAPFVATAVTKLKKSDRDSSLIMNPNLHFARRIRIRLVPKENLVRVLLKLLFNEPLNDFLEDLRVPFLSVDTDIPESSETKRKLSSRGVLGEDLTHELHVASDAVLDCHFEPPKHDGNEATTDTSV